MYLQNLSLRNFRVFSNSDFKFEKGINIISGPNGRGKTSILESIYYLALTRSFRSSADINAINYNENYFSIAGTILFENKNENSVFLSYSKEKKKKLLLNKKEVNKFSSYIGRIPCILLSLDDLKLTMGIPTNRRQFMDIVLSQVSSIYLQNLKSYKRIVLNKNKLLNEKAININKSELEVWNQQLVDFGTNLIKDRLRFVHYLNESISKYYSKFSRKKEKILVKYKSSINNDIDLSNFDNLKDNFFDKLYKESENEKEKKYSIIGPHRDDLLFLKDNKLFKEYGSQGENKTLIIVLKILECLYLTDQKNKNPIMLLDDIFGELDMNRIDGLLEFLDDSNQSFITTTHRNRFNMFSGINELSLNDSKEVYG